MKMVLNELSCDFNLIDECHGRNLFQDFLVLYSKAVHTKLDPSVILSDSFNNTLLAHNYPIDKWRNDGMVDQEIKRLYKILNSKADIIDGTILEMLEDKEFKCNMGAGIGLAIAHELEYISISFLSHEFWDASAISGTMFSLKDDGNIYQSTVEVPHLSKMDHLSEVDDWLGKSLEHEIVGHIQNGSLWEIREKYFPCLLFCDRIEQQFNVLKNTHEALRQVVHKLTLLNEYFEAWDGTSFDPTTLPKVRPESEATLIKYDSDHTFMAPNGQELIFSWHMYFTGNGINGRIFFWPDFQTSKAIIGHIGKKLPNVKYH